MLCYTLEADIERARALRTATNKPNASTPPKTVGAFLLYTPFTQRLECPAYIRRQS